ncbi:hypothetical protein FRC17_003564 [Serendipita sp. 399]|nr:hypothetical protein FRC17_003564 [Serendipita sp. 399]
MDIAPELLLDYYRRAADGADVWKRQDETPTPSTSVDTTSVSTVSTASTASTVSTASTASTLSTASTASTRSTTRSTSTQSSTASSSSSVVTSSYTTAVQTTDSRGNVFTTTLFISTTTVPDGNSGGGSSKTNTGAIVGGVIGGLTALVILVFIIWLVRRKMRKGVQYEDNIFEPDRNVERPMSMRRGELDLVGAGAGATAGAVAAAAAHDQASNITPYPYAQNSSAQSPSTHYGSSVAGGPEVHQAPPAGGYHPEMQQAYYPDHSGYNQYSQVPSINVGDAFPNPYAPGYNPSVAAAPALGVGAAVHAPYRGYSTSSGTSGYYPPTSPVHSQPSTVASPAPMSPSPTMTGAALAPAHVPSAKEREAFSRTHQAYTVSNPTEPTAPTAAAGPRNPSPTPSRGSATSPVVVHQDGGRAPVDDDDNEGEGEIPPTYDSIPRDPATGR